LICSIRTPASSNGEASSLMAEGESYGKILKNLF